MNSTLLFALGMAIATFFAALMLHQAFSKRSILGLEDSAPARSHSWLSPVGSAFLLAVGFAALVLTLA